MTKSKIHDYLMTLLIVVCIVVATVVCGWNITVPTAYAESEDIQSRYEQTNVINNLKGSTIGGKEFDIKDYPHNSNCAPQIITFVEFCYSYYADKQSDYGLYIYVYNPQDVAIDANTTRNKIQLTYGNKPSYKKYTLTFLNYSNAAGIEGRFYKFKIDLSEAERNDILNTVSPDERIYKVSGIELSVKNKVTEQITAQTYTYKGFAVGYGSELAETDTLSCKVDGFDKYVSLDVRSTYWRPEGTHAGGSLTDLITRDTLHSVYFAVPNRLIRDYGEMTAVHATWLNAYTNPIFVTGNKTVYDAVMNVVGQTMNGGDLDDYKSNGLDYALIASKITNGNGLGSLKNNHYNLYYGYNVFEKQSKHPSAGGATNVHLCDKTINKLAYAFYADNGNADNYVLPAEKLIADDGWFKTYSDKYGGDKVNDRYSRDLFETVDNTFTDINIRSTETYKLQDKIVSGDFWEILFGNWIKEEHEYEMQAIQKVTLSDISAINNKKDFCNKFYIAESDYDEFNTYVTEASAKDETVYLFRYYQSEYICAEVFEARRYYHNKAAFTSCLFHSDCPLGHGYYDEIDTNGYLSQMWVQLDFDIIDLTFTKDNVATIIPVVMNPMDIAADADHPVYVTDDTKGLAWWQILLAILLVILIIFLLWKFAPTVLSVLIKIIIFPFKLIGMVFKSISSATKPMRERNKLRRQERKAQMKLEREQRKERERQRKADEKQKRREYKIKRKEADKQRRRDEKSDRKRKKKEQRHDKRMRKQAERNYKDFEKYDEFPWCEERPMRKKKYSLAELDKMSDAELAEMYFETYGFDDADIPDDLFD